MKRNIREKALRIIVSSIIASDLSAEDIRSLSDYLGRNGDFAWELGALLNDISLKFNKYSEFPANLSTYNNQVKTYLKEALDIIKNRRLSIAQIEALMLKVDPNPPLIELNRITKSRLLGEFFNRGSEKQSVELLNLLRTWNVEPNDYLHGIMNKI